MRMKSTREMFRLRFAQHDRENDFLNRILKEYGSYQTGYGFVYTTDL